MGSWSTWGADSLPAYLWLGQRMPVNWNGMGGGCPLGLSSSEVLVLPITTDICN